MDLSAVFQCHIDQMDEEDILDTALSVLTEALVATPNSPPTPPPPSPPTPTGVTYVCDGRTQPLDDLIGGYDDYVAFAPTEQPAVNGHYGDAMGGDVYSQEQETVGTEQETPRLIMDLSAVFQCHIDQMDEEDILDTALSVLTEALVATPNPPPTPPPPSPPTPTGVTYVCDGRTQPLDALIGGYDDYVAFAPTEQPAVNGHYGDAMGGDIHSQEQETVGTEQETPRLIMDLSAVFQCHVDQMDEEDILDTALSVLTEALVATPNSPPTPPPPSPPTPTGVTYVCDGRTQPLDDLIGGYDDYIAFAPTEQPAVNGHYGDAMGGDIYSQEQYSPCPCPEYDSPGVATSELVYPDVQLLTLLPGLGQNLTPVGIKNGDMVYTMPEDALMSLAEPFSSQSISIRTSRKEKFCRQNQNHPYVKKPPNAFMLYMKEQRANVVAELATSNNALVNTTLGQRWRSLTGKDQDIYYEEAERLKKLHSEKYPWWSSRDNYGKKKKRIRRKYPTAYDEESQGSI